jgi:hypothetical protein
MCQSGSFFALIFELSSGQLVAFVVTLNLFPDSRRHNDLEKKVKNKLISNFEIIISEASTINVV